MKKEIDIFNNYIKGLINQLNDLIEAVNVYHEINNNIIKNYELKNRNYQILQNIKQINDNREIYKKINNINKILNFKEKLYNIFAFYNSQQFLLDEFDEMVCIQNEHIQTVASSSSTKEEDLKGECREGKNEF